MCGMPVYKELSDISLVNLLMESDQYAYTEIFERYKALLYQHAYRMLQDEDEVNDLVQDLFLTLWQKRENLDIKSSLSSYLYSAVRNRVFDVMAHQKVVNKYLESIKFFREEGKSVTDEHLRAKELARIIESSIHALPPKMREIYEITRDSDATYREVGELLQLSEKTVKQQVYNALKILRRKLENYLFLFLFF